ncbi:MAG: glycosyltransferase family 39 protein [Rhodospirillales bacterium]|nr:glycosyltransferase family 39 protein [Rhodospirillales bacterium]
MSYSRIQTLWVPAALLVLFCTVVAFRPLLPIDETRYLTVAWEMALRHDWLAPLTLNWEPYHHKPPILFWLINLSWSVFGVNRWAGTLPVIFAALANVYLTRILAQKLFRDKADKFELLPLLMVGSVPFLIYGTLVMFDITLTVFVLCALLALVSYAYSRRPVFILLLALSLGLGVLTKGPVAWLYVLFPVLLGPYWMKENRSNWSWYGGCLLAYILSLIPALLWLIPVVQASSDDFVLSLVWEQTAGRITGNMGSSHDRPFYFYLPLLPVLFLPWAFFPSFWKGIKKAPSVLKSEPGLRFLLCMVVPTLVVFSLIGGKQPHYLVPFLPAIIIFIAYTANLSRRAVALTVAFMLVVFVTGHVAGSVTVFKRYDLRPIASYIHEHEDKDWVFARKYQGEFNFLGRLTKPIAVENVAHMHLWFADHPAGFAIIRYDKPEEVAVYDMKMAMPYRGKNIGVFTLPSSDDL